MCMCMYVYVCMHVSKNAKKSVEDTSKRYDLHEDLGMFALHKNCSKSPWRIHQNAMTYMKI